MTGDGVKLCHSLADVRDNIDRLDTVLVPLLVERAGYVTQAAGFKPTRAAVVVPERIEAIVTRVRAMAADQGGPPELLEAIYRALIDAYIAHEGRVWDRLRAEE